MKRKISRREFMTDTTVSAIAVSTVAIGMHSCDTADKVNNNGDPVGKTITLDVNEPGYAVLAQTSGAVKIIVEGQTQPIVVVRISNDKVAAFSSECTHDRCSVNLPDSGGIVHCPCHGSTYNLEGKVLGGLAQRDLKSFVAKIEGAIITIVM